LRTDPYAPAVTAAEEHAGALQRLAEEIQEASWDLSLEYVEEGLKDDAVPSLARLGRVGQLGDIPTFVAELSKELADPQPARLRRGGQLAALVRDHAREREALGFAPREIVTEFLLIRRVLWRFVAERSTQLGAGEVLAAVSRLNDALDQLVTECVVAYFDRVTAELAEQARRDALTRLLNHQAFSAGLEIELERARRYEHGVTLGFLDVDDFKRVNDTLGHPEGDRVLRAVAELLRESLRISDIAGRMGGDEFAVCLLQSDIETGGIFLARIQDRIDEEVAGGRLPDGFGISAGLAWFPEEAQSADGLLRLADARLYEAKRAKGVG
jgi:diguanylate cyclase (GGDEF)-like protein